MQRKPIKGLADDTRYAETEYGFAVEWTDEGEQKLAALYIAMGELGMSPLEPFDANLWWALGALVDMKFAE